MEELLNENTTVPPVGDEPMDSGEEQATPVNDAVEDVDEGTDATDGEPDVEQLIAEAEQRGYLRGRNERIEVEMRRPSLLENNRNAERDVEVSQPLILNHLRRSVWD